MMVVRKHPFLTDARLWVVVVWIQNTKKIQKKKKSVDGGTSVVDG